MLVNLIYLKKNKDFIKDHVILAFVVILFSLHPTLTKFLFGVYDCIELDSGEYWLKNDLSIRCWSGAHLRQALTIALPAILIWVVFLPLLMLLILFRN